MTGATTKVQGKRKTKVGRVVSDRMDKTIVVSVERLARHRLYKRVIRLTTRFKAHDEENEARIGDTVLIEKGGDVIPKVVQVVADKRPPDTQPWEPPTACPVCGTPVAKAEGEVDRRCPNLSCPAQVEERLKHFARREAMDIEGIDVGILFRTWATQAINIDGLEPAFAAAMSRAQARGSTLRRTSSGRGISSETTSEILLLDQIFTMLQSPIH